MSKRIPVFLVHQTKELADGGAAEFRPFVSGVPLFYKVAFGKVGRRIVGQETGILHRHPRVGIPLLFKIFEIGVELSLELFHISFVDSPMVSSVVMVAAVGYERRSRRRLPAKNRRQTERNHRTGGIGTDGKILHPQAGKQVRQTPGHAIDIVLHCSLDRYAKLLEPLQRLQVPSVIALPRKFGHIEKHCGNLYTALPYIFQKAFYLLLGTYPEPFIHRPRCLAGPAETGIVGIRRRGVAIIQGIVYIAEMLAEYFGLRFCVAYIRMHVLHQIDCHLPGLGRYRKGGED